MAATAPVSATIAPTLALEVTASTTSSAATAFALFVATLAPVAVVTLLTSVVVLVFWSNFTGLEALNFLVTVCLLAFDDHLVVLELWLGINSKEFLGSCFRIELDEDATLEGPVDVTTETDLISRAILVEESLDLELCLRVFFAKALDINGASHGFIFEYFLEVGLGFVLDVFREGSLALYSRIVVHDLEHVTVLQCGDDGREWLKVSHALKAVNYTDRNRLVVVAI